jgi:hypothetical protein
VGAVSDIFTFNFIDFAPAGSVGTRNYQLNLAVSGNVFDPVPETGQLDDDDAGLWPGGQHRPPPRRAPARLT